MKTYNPNSEYKVEISQPEVKAKIAEAKQKFRKFVDEFKDLNLTNEQSVEWAHEFAKQRGIFDLAENIKNLIFGRDITTYGVSYISDSCVSGCTYCPMRRDSVDTRTKKTIKRKKLCLDEFVKDTQEIIKDGHSHICFLTGDGELTTNHPEGMTPYLQALDKMEGIDEIILNVTPQTIETFKIWREAVKNKSLQFRVFQEVYDKEIYQAKHPFGPKADYQFRKDSQARAIEAGFDNYGLGILLGINPKMLQEIEMLVGHAEEMTRQYGRAPARVCLPTANTLAGVNNVEKQHYVSAKANELAYALTRLAMPEISIVSSERDTPEMLRILDRYATNRTVDVQPSVGGNLKQAISKDSLLKQTTVHPTDSDSTRRDYESRGYNLLFRY